MQRMVGAEQPVDHRRLVMLDAPDLRQRHAQLAIHSRGGVREAHRLHLDAVHQNDAHAREGVVVQLADRLAGQLAPREALLSSGVPRSSKSARVMENLRVIVSSDQ